MNKTVPNILSIAGSDPSGGAGVQADLKVFSALGCYGMAAMAALTVQNTVGVRGVHAVPAEFVGDQVRAVFDDISVDAVKIGMIGAAETVAEVAQVLESVEAPVIVLDPVMVATSGDSLIDDAAKVALVEHLIPLADVITPNIPEAEALLGHPVEDVRAAALELLALGAEHVVLKGGHADTGDVVCDVWAHDGQVQMFEMPRIEAGELHGTGCTLSSALACYLALGFDMADAVRAAQAFVARGIMGAQDLDVGRGSKVLSLDPFGLKRRLVAAQASGQTVGRARGRVLGEPRSRLLGDGEENEAVGEFDLIETYFAPLSMDGLVNDGAALDVPEGMALVVSTDTLNEGVHFMEGAEPADIAAKALRVNLSDLAAMGARPYAYQLSLSLPKGGCDAAWFAAFSAALKVEQESFGIALSGGDTTSNLGGGLSVSMTAFGLVPAGEMVGRDGARDGDVIVVTGSIGDAALGLDCLLNFPCQGSALPRLLLDTGVQDGEAAEYFVSRYTHPMPRVALADMLRKYAHAAVDVSDGLVADVGHMAKASKLCAVVRLGDVPLSDQAQAAGVEPLSAATRGDDYELAVAISADDVDAFVAAAAGLNIPVTVIGEFKSGGGVEVLDGAGVPMEISRAGWTHF